MSELKLLVVSAMAGSKVDNIGGLKVYSDNFVPLRVREYNRSTPSFLEALLNALVCISCVAVGLLIRGLRAKDFMVQVDVATGRNEQFGAVLIAGGRLPTSIVISEELDLSHPDQARLADVYNSQNRTHFQNMMLLVKEAALLVANEADEDVLSLPETVYYQPNCIAFRVLATLYE